MFTIAEQCEINVKWNEWEKRCFFYKILFDVVIYMKYVCIYGFRSRTNKMIYKYMNINKSQNEIEKKKMKKRVLKHSENERANTASTKLLSGSLQLQHDTHTTHTQCDLCYSCNSRHNFASLVPITIFMVFMIFSTITNTFTALRRRVIAMFWILFKENMQWARILIGFPSSHATASSYQVLPRSKLKIFPNTHFSVSRQNENEKERNPHAGRALFPWLQDGEGRHARSGT